MSTQARGDGARGESSRWLVFLAWGVGSVLTWAPGVAAQVQRLSVGPGGVEADNDSGRPSLSRDGRYVSFVTAAKNLAGVPVTAANVVLLRDRDPDGNGVLDDVEGANRIVTAGPGGVPANGTSPRQVLAGLGRALVFESDASNLVPGDTNGDTDIFVTSLPSGVIERVSVTSSGAQVHGDSRFPDISADGRFVVFESSSAFLVSGLPAGSHIYLHDRQTGVTELVDRTSTGQVADGAAFDPHVSDDGRFVAFRSFADNLHEDGLGASPPSLMAGVFVRDRLTGCTLRASESAGGVSSNGNCFGVDLSGDGRCAVFVSSADNLVPGASGLQVYAKDLIDGGIEVASRAGDGAPGNGISNLPAVSADGRWVSFMSHATNLVAGDPSDSPDIFVHDRRYGTTDVLTVSWSAGLPAGSSNGFSCVTPDGRHAVFESFAADIVPGDGNGHQDVFALQRCPPAASLVYGVGWPGTLSVPHLDVDAPPALGTTPKLLVGNSSGRTVAALLFIGASAGVQPTPQGGTLLVDGAVSVTLTLRAEGGQMPLAIPDDAALCGLSLFVQSLQPDGGAPGGYAFSPGLQLVLGS